MRKFYDWLRLWTLSAIFISLMLFLSNVSSTQGMKFFAESDSAKKSWMKKACHAIDLEKYLIHWGSFPRRHLKLQNSIASNFIHPTDSILCSQLPVLSRQVLDEGSQDIFSIHWTALEGKVFASLFIAIGISKLVAGFN